MLHANACDLLNPVQITKLRLAGFKSFVHPTELAIGSGLTGVVGPNGCGKSNLIDALRWVMGETSARGLRGGEMDDVIFAGTAARPAFDLAEVSLRIETPVVTLPGLGELDELELSRRIGRGIGSVFRVNGKELRARDVQLLFADAASGARSAAIVGQGQIGALLDAKPADRRRLIEEAAGVGGLQARRHEAELKLQASEANLVRVQDLLLTLEEQHQSLCRQARQAERYRKLSAAYRETEALLLVGRWRLARTELAGARQALEEGRADAASQAERLTAARLERERAAELVAERRAAEAELATELARLSERLGAYDDEAARIHANRARLEERERQIGQDLAHGEASLEDARASEERLARERGTLAITLEQLTRDLDRAATEAAEAEASSGAAEAELREALSAQAEAKARLKQLGDRRAQAGRDRELWSLPGRISTPGSRLWTPRRVRPTPHPRRARPTPSTRSCARRPLPKRWRRWRSKPRIASVRWPARPCKRRPSGCARHRSAVARGRSGTGSCTSSVSIWPSGWPRSNGGAPASASA